MAECWTLQGWIWSILHTSKTARRFLAVSCLDSLIAFLDPHRANSNSTPVPGSGHHLVPLQLYASLTLAWWHYRRFQWRQGWKRWKRLGSEIVYVSTTFSIFGVPPDSIFQDSLCKCITMQGGLCFKSAQKTVVTFIGVFHWMWQACGLKQMWCSLIQVGSTHFSYLVSVCQYVSVVSSCTNKKLWLEAWPRRLKRCRLAADVFRLVFSICFPFHRQGPPSQWSDGVAPDWCRHLALQWGAPEISERQLLYTFHHDFVSFLLHFHCQIAAARWNFLSHWAPNSLSWVSQYYIDITPSMTGSRRRWQDTVW